MEVFFQLTVNSCIYILKVFSTFVEMKKDVLQAVFIYISPVIHISNKPVRPRSQRDVINPMKIWIVFLLLFLNTITSHENWQYGFPLTSSTVLFYDLLGGRNRIGRREKWSKKSWEEGEIGGKAISEICSNLMEVFSFFTATIILMTIILILLFI